MSFHRAFIIFCCFLIFFVVSRHAELILWPLPVPLGSALLKPFSFFRFRLCFSILSPLDLFSMVSIIRFGLFLSAIVCTSIFLPHFCFSFSARFDMYDVFLLFTHKNKPKGSSFFVLNVVCCSFSPWFGMYDGFFVFSHKNKPKTSTFLFINVVCCSFSAWFRMCMMIFDFFRTK
ncbi:hypothetical protein AAZV13_05G091900 [Glycine max]